MRQTSIDTYNKVKASGLLSRMRLLVFEILCRHDYNDGEGMTANELQHTAELVYHIKNGQHLHKRFSELERMGVVAPHGQRECKRTGNMSIVWSITGNMPVKLPPADPSTKGQRVNRAIEKLRELWDGKKEMADWIELADMIKAI